MLIYLDPTEGEKIQQGPRARGFWQLKDLKVQKIPGGNTLEKWVPEKIRVGKVGPCQFVCCGFKLGNPRVGREENLKM